MKRKCIQLGAALLCAAATFITTTKAHSATHTWTGASPLNANWSTAANWSGNNPPTVGERFSVVIFPAFSQDYAPVQDIDNLEISQIKILGNYTFHGTGGAYYKLVGTNDVVLVGANSTFDDDVVIELEGKPDFIVSNAVTLTVQSPLQGSGGLNKRGAGTMRTEGMFGNTHTGETYVWEGTLQLAKTSGVSIPGNLVVGDHVGGSKVDKVILQTPNQIADAAWITVNSSGQLNLNNFNDTLGPLSFYGGEVATGTGTLTLNSFVGAFDAVDPAINDSAYLKGKVNIGYVARWFSVSGEASLDVLGTISGSGHFHKDGSGLMILSDSNAFSGTFTIHDGSVMVFDPWALGSIAGHTYVLDGATLEMGYSSIVNGETLHLNGLGFNGLGALSAENGFGTPNFIGNIVLDSNASISVGSNLTLMVKAVISGPGGYHKLGEGELWLDGAAANTYAGSTWVDAGLLRLGKAANVVAVPGTLFVGDNIGDYESDVLLVDNNGQIATASVTVRSTGFIDVQQFTQSLGSLTMDGSAHINVDPNGLLNLPTLITFTGLNAVQPDTNVMLFITSSIDGGGAAHLPNATTINSTWVNRIGLNITGGASAHVTKTGPGWFTLDGSNSYSGITFVKSGVLSTVSGGLGNTTGATVVTNSGSLSIGSGDYLGEALVLATDHKNDLDCAFSCSSTSTWSGPITLLSNSIVSSATPSGGLLRLSGAISGSGSFIKIGSKMVEFAGAAANTYSGATFVNQGTLLLNKTGVIAVPGTLTVGDATNAASFDEVRLLAADQIANSSVVDVKSTGWLNLNNHSETIGSIQGAGSVNTGLGTLTAGGNNFTTTFSGFMGGVGFTTFVKQGTGTMLFTGTNTGSGRTIVIGGRLLAHGNISAAIIVSNTATLGGNGFVGNVFATNGVVSPGAGAGLIDTKSITLNSSSSLRIELNGTNAGINCDQLNVIGSVTLGNCVLNGTLGFASAVSNKFKIVNNDGADAVVGTFAGIAEGGTTLIGGATFKVSYVGGDGNDVVLTQITPPPQPMSGQVTRLPGGQIQINGQGVPGTTYNVFATTNLNTQNWISIGTANPSPVTGNMQFTDTDAPNHPMRFYQFVLLP